MANMNQDSVVTNSVVTDELTMDGIRVDGITTSISTMPNNKLVASQALTELVRTVDKLYTKLSPNSSFLEEITVMTPSLVNRFFTHSDEWIMDNWGITTEGAKCAGVTNKLSISTSTYPKAGAGHYYCVINILSLPCGSLDVYVNDTWIRNISAAGTSAFEIELSAATDVISFVYIDGVSTQEIVVSELGLHHITNSFVDYLTSKITQLATIDAEGYLRRDEFTHEMNNYLTEFNQISDRFTSSLDSHMAAINPHSITTETIGAAAIDHVHDEYEQIANLEEDVTGITATKYAPIVHYHSNYVDVSTFENTVENLVSNSMSDVVSLTPLTIITGDVGRLPMRYATAGLSAPAQLLLPTKLIKHTDTTYDESIGTVDADKQELINEVARAFSDSEYYANINDTSKFNFRISFHTARKLTGYTLTYVERDSTGALAKPKEWNVISGDTTFVHRYNPTTDELNNGSITINFDTPILADALTFSFVDFEKTSDDQPARIKIAILTDVTEENVIFTENACKVCIPNSGSNRVITIDSNTVKQELTSKTPGMRYYCFAKSESALSIPELFWSIVPPEYSNARTGVDLYVDTFTKGCVGGSREGCEYSSHPDLGTLTLKEGSTLLGNLTDIYSDDNSTWMSDECESVILEQTIPVENTLLSGYQLSWKTTQSDIPTGWTVTVEGKDANGRTITTVVDSVETFYPFYSVADDDIVYFKKFDNAISVSKITIALKQSVSNSGIALSLMRWFVSQHWYSIPANTIYLGSSATASVCLGSVYCNEKSQLQISNQYVGTSCTVPVNNLGECACQDYTIANPFHTEEIMCSIKSYAFIDDVMASQAYVLSVTTETITVRVVTLGKYGVQIQRLF